jgi:uncharacterized protein (UPF0261 family)
MTTDVLLGTLDTKGHEYAYLRERVREHRIEVLGFHATGVSAGPERLEAAGELGLPRVSSLGTLDLVNFGPRGFKTLELMSRA